MEKVDPEEVSEAQHPRAIFKFKKSEMDELMNGEVWCAKEGEDYTPELKKRFISYLRYCGRKRGLTVNFTPAPEGQLHFQAFAKAEESE